MEEDRTLQVSSLFSLSIRVEKGQVVKQPANFPSRFVVGRSEGSDLQFADSFVGRSHVEMWFDRGHWWVKDLGSVNKTYLNGELLDQPKPLPSSGTVELGKDGVVLSVAVGELADRRSPTPFSQQFLEELGDPPSLPVVGTPGGLSKTSEPSKLELTTIKPRQVDAEPSLSQQDDFPTGIDDFLGFLKQSGSATPSTDDHGASVQTPEPDRVDDLLDNVEETTSSPEFLKEPSKVAVSSELESTAKESKQVDVEASLSLQDDLSAINDDVGDFQKHSRSTTTSSGEQLAFDNASEPDVVDEVVDDVDDAVLDPEFQEPPASAAPQPEPSSLTGYIHDLVRDDQLSLDEKGQKIRDAVRGKIQDHTRWYHWLIAGISCVAIVVGGWAVKNHFEIQALRENAMVMFSSIKAQQMEVMRIEAFLSAVAPPNVLQDVMNRREAIQLMYKDYDAYLEKIGVYQSDLSDGDQIILRMARLFGECEVDMPSDFLKTVKTYIRKWQSTPRLREAIQRAVSHQYPQKVSEIMLQHGLPPQFFYLALQESDFDVRKVGPSRPPYGIAKGPWQFMPATAMDYKLRLGPLVKHPQYDPQDERHDFRKSTVAAAKHLRHLYTTEAQASSLLVFASYNWGQGNMRKVITQMPENPRERNFWRLLKNFDIPRETYDYVLYIFSAVVIGENPKLWGFEFENPLAGVSPRPSLSS